MRKVLLVSLSVVFILVSAMSAGAADVIKLKAANYLPTTHKMSVLTAQVLPGDQEADERAR